MGSLYFRGKAASYSILETSIASKVIRQTAKMGNIMGDGNANNSSMNLDSNHGSHKDLMGNRHAPYMMNLVNSSHDVNRSYNSAVKMSARGEQNQN